jgi:hypothetical protein
MHLNNCVPQAGKVTTTCGSNTIQVQIDPCLLDGTHTYSDAFVGSGDNVPSQCKLYDEAGTALVMSHGLDECGTIMEYDAATGKINFTNEMTIPSNLIDGSIFTSAPISWNFQCSYDTSIDITSDEISMDATSRTGDFSGTGEFDVEMSFYKSINFDQTIDTAEHQVGQSINFGITFNGGFSIHGLQFAPTSCEVINGNDDTEVYELWDSSDDMMCNPEDHPVDFEVYQTPSFANQFFGFQFTGFAFNSVNDDVAPQQLKCHVEICLESSDDSPCSTGCFEPTTTTKTTTTTTTTTTAVDEFENPPGCSFQWDQGSYSSECGDSCYTYTTDHLTFTCTLSIWNECDSSFVDHHGDDCAWYRSAGCINGAFSTRTLLNYGSFTPSQGLKTALVCPGCGCSAETGPISLRDYDAKYGSRSIDAFGPSIEEYRNNPKED